jgi:non-heme chloroperoxidase
VPTLISYGAIDDVVLSKAAQELPKDVSHAEISAYANSSHMPFFEDAPRFNQELGEFVKKATT